MKKTTRPTSKKKSPPAKSNPPIQSAQEFQRYNAIMLEQINDKLNTVIDKVISHDEKFEQIDSRFNKMDRRFDTLENAVLQNGKEIQKIHKKLGSSQKSVPIRVKSL